MEREYDIFEEFHNTHHRYSALKGATPKKWQRRQGFTPRLLDPGSSLPTQLPRRGQVEFVRLIRSDRLIKVLDAKITLPEELVHRYFTATLHLPGVRSRGGKHAARRAKGPPCWAA